MNRRWAKSAAALVLLATVSLAYFSYHDSQHTNTPAEYNVRTGVQIGRAAMAYDNEKNQRDVADTFRIMENEPYRSSTSKVVYNRVGKCGSRSMLSLMSKLSGINKFTLFDSRISNHTQASLKERLEIARKISMMPSPSIYTRHLHYLDFVKYGVVQPMYINLVRDPIDRFLSHYNYLRFGDNSKAVGRTYSMSKTEKEMDINDCVLGNHSFCSKERLFYIIPYFCGQDVLCQSPSKESLQRAKMHLLQNYLVVGYLEDFAGMIYVLETLLPEFFYGASDLWKQMSVKVIKRTSTFKKSTLNRTAREVLQVRLEEEYEFYHFVKRQFKASKNQLLSADYKN